MAATTDRDICLKLHRLFRLIQRQNRFSTTAPNTELTLLESHVILEVDASRQVSLGELSKLLHTDQGNLSRIVNKLESRLLLATCGDPHDGRRRLITAGKKAPPIMKEIDAHADAQIAGSLERLSRRERELVSKLYRTIAEASAQAPVHQRTGEHPLRPLQRQVTRAFGLLGDSAYASGLSSTSFQVLALLSDVSAPLSPKAICDALVVKASRLSSILNSFEKQKVLNRRPDPNDKRHVSICLSEHGRKKFEAMEGNAAKELKALLEEVPRGELADSLIAVSRYAEGGASSGAGRKLHLKLIEGADRDLRAFIVRNIVRLNFEEHLPETICGEKTLCYAAFSDDSLLAVIQFARQGTGFELDCIAWAESIDRSVLLHAVVDSALKDFERRRVPVSARRRSAFMKGAAAKVAGNSLIIPVEADG